MMAEIYGKSAGLCKGKGGSMHIADFDKGMLGANGIVGGGFPLACGAALTAKYKKTKNVSVCFFGDGANNQGTFHEGINLAAIWKLPVIFVAENNGYGEATPFSYASSCESIARSCGRLRDSGHSRGWKRCSRGFPGCGPGDRACKNGEGPTLIECMTYRNYGHFEGDAQRYKTNDEKAVHQEEKDAIAVFKSELLAKGLMSEEEQSRIEKEVEEAVEQASHSAKKALIRKKPNC
jgi:pyruvate dehydrogenase E1 component alpha subunit